jgi:hypothetical protein
MTGRMFLLLPKFANEPELSPAPGCLRARQCSRATPPAQRDYNFSLYLPLAEEIAMNRTAGHALVLSLLVSCLAFAQAPAAPTQRIRGDVVSIDGLALRVKERSGAMLDIKLSDNYVVASVAKVGVDAITPNAFVGTATMPQSDGTQTALEVLVFPESGRGSGEGHYPWDLQPGSMMTNATVAEVVAMGPSRRMTLRYKDGEKIIVVPPNTPIVTFESGDRAMLKAGAHVLLTAVRQPDGSLTATRVAVGKDGLVPPM